jgi:hypothetical protein
MEPRRFITVFTRAFYWSTQEAERRKKKHEKKKGRKEKCGIEGKKGME